MLRHEINEKLKAAMRDQDRCRLATLRLINCAIKDRDIAARGSGREEGVSDDEIRQIMIKMIKQREESSKVYEEAGRLDLAEQEREEMAVIRSFLPKQLSEDEMRSACANVVSEINATCLRDMGRTMTALKERFPGQMDFGRASTVVKDLLAQ